MPHLRIMDSIRLNKGVAAPVIKERLAAGEKELRKTHAEDAAGTGICKSYTLLVDDVLKALFAFKSEELECREGFALVAVGGYGRGELNIRSDIDLMLLYKKRLTPEIENLTNQALYSLWDTGLDLGFSIRSVDECIALARDDLKTMTAFLDLRFLLGDGGLFDLFSARIRKDLFNRKRSDAFINDKIEESRARRAKYGGSVYILEPNVKEGEGGLRDIHTAKWVVKAKSGEQVEPFSIGLISAQDKKAIEESLDFLLWIRNELHFATNRKTDQLSFDHQERIAGMLGFENSPHALAVESFMQHYYRHASNIDRYSNLILSRCLHRGARKPFLWSGKTTGVDHNYSIANNVLTLCDPDAFRKDPRAVIKAFEYSQEYDVEIDQAAKDRIIAFLDESDGGFRESRDVSDSFIRILRGGNAYRTLLEMHRLKFLDKYIPEFEEINCRVQHDLYHIYTVDAHTLFAIREIERLKGEYKSEFALLSTIYEETANPEILMLAVLFHDIGKARGKGHAEKGAAMIPEICRRLNLPEDASALIEFLVENHLILANTAQYRDLHDDKLVIEFARKVGDMQRLNLLYLLTFADVRAVGPDVWSQWKGALFQELYFKVLTVLERGTFEVVEAAAKIREIRHKVLGLQAGSGATEADVDDYFGLLPQRYFLSNSPDAIAGHMALLKKFVNVQYLMTVRQDTAREYTEIIVCTYDVYGLFSMITGVMAANAVNILGAQINTLKNGIALDVLQVNTPLGELITDEGKLKKMEKDLSDVITGRVRIAELVGRRRPSILDRKAKPKVRTTVQIDNDVSDAYTVIDIHTQNRIGLLYDITSALSRLGLYIYIAKISTKGESAADIFYVKDIFGQKIYYKERLREIVDTLYNLLTDREPAANG